MAPRSLYYFSPEGSSDSRQTSTPLPVIDYAHACVCEKIVSQIDAAVHDGRRVEEVVAMSLDLFYYCRGFDTDDAAKAAWKKVQAAVDPKVGAGVWNLHTDPPTVAVMTESDEELARLANLLRELGTLDVDLGPEHLNVLAQRRLRSLASGVASFKLHNVAVDMEGRVLGGAPEDKEGDA